VVRSRIVHAVATLTLLASFLCPVLQMFDHWDHELQTGQDTESTLILVTLCAGAVCALAKLIITFAPGLSAKRFIPDLLCMQLPASFAVRLTGLAVLSESPPLSLRI